MRQPRLHDAWRAGTGDDGNSPAAGTGAAPRASGGLVVARVAEAGAAATVEACTVGRDTRAIVRSCALAESAPAATASPDGSVIA